MPHGWERGFAQDVADDREDMLARVRDHFAKARSCQ